MNDTRSSNFELIRIIAMFLIVIGHILGHGFKNNLSIAESIYPFTVIGVNLFVFITGYFGINFKWKSLINLIGITIFYSFLSFICSILLFNETILPIKVINLFLPISHNGYYWFISAYIFLYLLSPIFTIALRRLTDKQLIVLIIILTYINCGSGWLFNNSINLNGYNTMQFIYIYILGYSLSKFKVPYKLKQYHWIIIYLTFTIINPIIFETHPSKILRYNNPLVIIAAISLLSFICSYSFKSKSINFIASCTLPIYLLQDGMLGQHIYKLQYSFWQIYQDNISIMIAFVLLCTIGFFIVAMIIEPIRKKFMNPFINSMAKLLEKYKLDIFYIPKNN